MAIGFKLGNININTNNLIKIKCEKTTSNSLTGFSGTDINNTVTLYFYQTIGYNHNKDNSDCLTSIDNSSATYSGINAYSCINYTAINMPIVAGHVKRTHYSASETNNPIDLTYGWTANNVNKVIIIIQTGSVDINESTSPPIYQITNKTSTGCTIKFNFWDDPNWNRAVDLQIIEIP